MRNPPADHNEIAEGLRRLGPRTLLFLRELEGIEWSIEDGDAGLYLCSTSETSDDFVHRVTVIGQASVSAKIDESWLVFSKPVYASDGKRVGFVELAFSLKQDANSTRLRVQPVPRSPFVVFFPTAIETHLGFLLQVFNIVIDSHGLDELQLKRTPASSCKGLTAQHRAATTSQRRMHGTGIASRRR